MTEVETPRCEGCDVVLAPSNCTHHPSACDSCALNACPACGEVTECGCAYGMA